MTASEKIFAINCALGFLKLYSNTLIQAYALVKYKYVRYREDQLFLKNAKISEQQPELHYRASQMWRNDLENVVPFFILVSGLLVTEISSNWLLIHSIGFWTSRTFHAIFLLKPQQPQRTLSYNFGILILLVMTGQILWATL